MSVLTNFTKTIEKINKNVDEEGNSFKNANNTVVTFINNHTYITEENGQRLPIPLMMSNLLYLNL